LAALFIAGGVAGGHAGTLISRHLSTKKGALNIAFASLIFVVALYMIWRSASALMG
jgi:uncharacterized protein